MKKENLRIGNLIKQGNSILRIYDLNELHIYAQDIETGKKIAVLYTEVMPIALNHNMLEKIGFKKANYITSYSLYWLEKNIDYSKSISVSLHDGFCRFNIIDTEIRILRFVHELQNIIWSISGKDIEF